MSHSNFILAKVQLERMFFSPDVMDTMKIDQHAALNLVAPSSSTPAEPESETPRLSSPVES